MKNAVLRKPKLAILLGIALILFMVPACHREKATQSSEKKNLLPVMLEARLDPAEATLGDRVTYTLSLNRMKDIDAELPEPGSAPDGLTPVDAGHAGPENLGDRILEKQWTTYRVNHTGSLVFPAVKLRYQQKGAEKETEAPELTLQVKSVISDDMKDIRGLKPLEGPGLDQRLIYAGAAVIAIVLLAAVSVWLYRRRRKKPEQEQPPLPPDQEALQSLRELEVMGLIASGDFKRLYYILSEIFRRYLERGLEFPAVERTTEEILRSLEALNVTETLRADVRTFLYNTDPVKFAGISCNRDEAVAEMERVRRFVEETSRRAEEANTEAQHVAA